jgi:hypothetical protein
MRDVQVAVAGSQNCEELHVRETVVVVPSAEQRIT